MSNTFGKIFTFTSFGESHGKAVGGVIDGCPPNILIDFEFIQSELDRRRTGILDIISSRTEDDEVEFLSGVFEGKTLGTPIAFIIRNKNQISSDYQQIKDIFRPSHADYTYFKKYGLRDYRGGGRSSARETAARVVAGAIAKLILKEQNIEILSYTSQIGPIFDEKEYKNLSAKDIENSEVRCPNLSVSDKMVDYLKSLKKEGDTIGGIVKCIIKGVPTGWGEPVFDKFHARLSSAMMSIPAAHGFDYGEGFKGIEKKGSELNDPFTVHNGNIKTKSNHSGGIQGGISNGQDIYFRVMFKPIPSISKNQQSIDKSGNKVELSISGRHDICVIPRVIPVVESMAAITLVDFFLMNFMYKKV